MIEASYVYGLIGGLVIGLAAAIHLLGNGRIMGASGVVGGLIDGSRGAERRDRALFVGGLIGAPWIALSLSGRTVEIGVASDAALLVAAGLLVGFGARLANGCTSGHGVCGLSRFSVRSLVAVGLFLAAGVASVFAVKHVIGAA